MCIFLFASGFPAGSTHFPGSAAAAAAFFLLAEDAAPHFTPKGRLPFYTNLITRGRSGKPPAVSLPLLALPVRLMAHNLLRNSPDLCIILNHFEFAFATKIKKIERKKRQTK